MHGLGRMLKVVHEHGTLFVSVIRWSLGYFFVMVNFVATGRLRDELRTSAATTARATAIRSTASGRPPGRGRGGDLVTVARVVAVALFVVGLSIRDVYELLKRSHRVDPTDARVFAVVFTSMVTMWLSWFAIGALAPTRIAVPDVVRWTGLGAVLAGAAVSVGGMWQLGGVENIDHLVTTGLFSKVRHPMYLGFILWIVGWCAYTGAPANLFLAPAGLASVLLWRHLEEAELSSAYADEYRGYRASTWW